MTHINPSYEYPGRYAVDVFHGAHHRWHLAVQDDFGNLVEVPCNPLTSRYLKATDHD